ncbi:hypothetical protein A0J61_03812 [Choanephora cucurbitarum]|uniref:PIN domain-containing protein n=1 Tax=Choanephora cucurbitarum TaxID=101091 RepID=A0A1C7NLG2_9FUNG|nr:hypothetical protein A0J61_03812 [Choanephora cucurbitarum]
MSKRRGGSTKRRDNDFNRNMSREGHLDRQLFDPRSDNPIAFNKKSSQPQQKTQETRRPVVSGRRIWSAEDSSSEHLGSDQRQAGTTEKRATPSIVRKKASPEPKTDTAPISQEESLKKRKLKALIASLRSIEAKLESLAEKSQALPCFQADTDSQYDYKDKSNKQQQQHLLVEQDVIDAESIWKEKIKLHLELGDKYIDILEHDLDYAQKKGLESLCWKRAVYSLVDQFRRSLKKSTDTINALNHRLNKKNARSELEAMLLEGEEANGDNISNNDEIPVIQEGGGMTFVKVERANAQKDPQDSVEHELKLQTQLARMTLMRFLHYLDLADAFYLKLTCFFKRIEDNAATGEDDDSMEQCLSQWRRTNKYKWYSCIPLRGDLGRYRWVYVPENEDTAITHWTKQEAFLEAWKRYCLGIWLMPAKGNLYFNLSLILPSQDYDMHKFYLSTRSLMVRRNGFLNARESMLVLFEGNRRWVQKNILDPYNTKHSKNQKNHKRSKLLPTLEPDVAIPALLMRLHGMLFTKIGLDEFPQVKRIFFDTLFVKKTETQRMAERFAFPVSKEEERSANMPVASFSGAHLFWFETIVLCLSSLYAYDYANAKLTKLIAAHSNQLFYPDSSKEDDYKSLLDGMSDNILFSYEIDLTCQIAVELLERYLNTDLPSARAPTIPDLPHMIFRYRETKAFIFEEQKKDASLPLDINNREDEEAWIVYMEVLLHWMVLTGVCIRLDRQPSLWELLVGDISHDLMFDRYSHLRAREQGKVSTAFWPLLIQFLNKLLSQLNGEDKYDLVNKHLMEDEVSFENDGTHSEAELLFTKNVCDILGRAPDLPEEHDLRGLGWVDEIHGRFLRLEAVKKPDAAAVVEATDITTRRKIRILEYGFTLVKHLDGILYYDPVEEIFTESKSIEEKMAALELASVSVPLEQNTHVLLEDDEEHDTIVSMGCTTIEEMDDDVLLSNQVELDDDDQENDDDDIMTQLKKRREQLQAIVTTAEAEQHYGFRRLPSRVKEREARLNYLRECIIPGKTILVLDTNCFIGHIDHVKKLLQSQTWSVIVPLVVVTELDGLRTNPHRLGSVAQQGIELLEDTLSSKPKQSTSLRIQTSHNNFMNDISIRSEQFVFGETDKNLDDLILSSCLWWISQQPQTKSNDSVVPVCLVTGDRNLSVKARARDVEVVPVSAIIQLTP